MTESDVPLREYVDMRLQVLEARLASERDADRHALDMANATLDARLMGMNEFRAQINRERAEYITKESLEAHLASTDAVHGGHEERLRSLESSRNFLWGAIGAIIGAWGIVQKFWGGFGK